MNLRNLDPRVRSLIDLALASGASIREGRHYVLTLPSGRNLVYPRSSRSSSGILNSIALTKRTLRAEGILK